MPNDDERNVDEQLDEQQRKIDERDARPLVENHMNNTRSPVTGASGVIDAKTTTVTDPSANKESRP